MILSNGIIEPGNRIGDYLIGSDKQDILDRAGEAIHVWERGDGFCIYTYENYMLWFDEKGCLCQIGVTKGFLDGYNNIYIGSTMQDVIKIYGTYENDDVQYLIPNINGICFELEDVDDYDDDWDELTAPIEWIFVYKC